MRKTGGVPPMGRLIERAEFEKRLADYSTQILKSFKRYGDVIEAQDERIAALETEILAMRYALGMPVSDELQEVA